MKILFLSREYPPLTNYGGIGSYVSTIAPALQARGHDVHVLSCVRDQSSVDLQDSGVWIHRRPLRHVPGLGRATRLPATVARISAALSCLLEMRGLGADFDVVEMPDWLAEGLLVSFQRQTPTVAFLHTPLYVIENYAHRLGYVDRRLADLLERLSVRRATIVTSPTERLVHLLSSPPWLGRAKAEIVRLPVETDGWAPSQSPAMAGPKVLYTGRLEARKAPEVLVKAAAELAPTIPGLEVFFLGASAGVMDGRPYKEWLEHLASNLGAPCMFPGQIHREDLVPWLGWSRVVAVPSRDDNFPMSGLEALAAGRPIVCTRDVGLAEIISGSDAGSVVATDDPSALAAALRPYLEDAAWAHRSGLLGQALVRRVCSPAQIAKEREGLYEKAVQNALKE